MLATLVLLSAAACGGGGDSVASDVGASSTATTVVATADTANTSTTTTSAAKASPASSIKTQSSIEPTMPFSSLGGNIQMLGDYPLFTSMAEPGIVGSGNVLGSPLRFGHVKDPKGSGATVFRFAYKSTDPSTASASAPDGTSGLQSGTTLRVDITPPNNQIAKGVTYWIVYRMLIPSVTWTANDYTTLSSIHTGGAGTGNFGLEISKGNFQAVRARPGSSQNQYWNLGNYADQWVTVVEKFRLSAGSDGFIQIWLNGVQKVDDTGANSPSSGGDYAKMAFYNYSFGGGYGDSSKPEREMFYGSFHIVKDAGYTFDQVSALVN